MQGFSDDLLGDGRAIGIGGIDEVDAELDGAAKYSDGLLAVRRRAPDAPAGESHGAEAHAVDGELAPKGECAGGGHDG